MDVRHCYAAGIALALVGSLVVVAGMVLAGSAATGSIALAFALRNVFRREDFDRDHSLGYRFVNWGGAVFSLALGLFMLAVGVVSFDFFV